jgi:hypothetical protein
MKDIIFETDVEQIMVSTQLTASKTDMNVVDLGAAGIEAEPVGAFYFLVGVDAIATASAGNSFAFKVFHADAKASDTALTSGVEVTTSTGLYLANPVVAATTLTTQAQKCLLIGYRGIKRYLQLQPTETGTADMTVSVYGIMGHLDSKHGDKVAG